MFVLVMLGALGVSTVVIGVVNIVRAGKNSEETKRQDRKRRELWQRVVANVDGPTQSQLHLQAVKEDNERTELSMREALGMIFGFSRPSKSVVEVSPVEPSPVEEKAAATA